MGAHIVLVAFMQIVSCCVNEGSCAVSYCPSQQPCCCHMADEGREAHRVTATRGRTPHSHQVSLTAINIKQINPKTRLSSKHADADLHNQILCMFQVTI